MRRCGSDEYSSLRGRRKNGRGGVGRKVLKRGKGNGSLSSLPNPPPFFPSSLSPTPFNAATQAMNIGQRMTTYKVNNRRYLQHKSYDHFEHLRQSAQVTAIPHPLTVTHVSIQYLPKSRQDDRASDPRGSENISSRVSRSLLQRARALRSPYYGRTWEKRVNFMYSQFT